MRVFKQKYRNRNGKLKDSAKWYVEFKDHTETTRRIPGFTDKKITEELGRRIEKLVAFRVLGNAPDPDLARWLESLPNELREKLTKHSLLDSRTVAGGKPLIEHLDDFHASLLHKGDSQDHADLVKARALRIRKECKFKFFTDISASKVQKHLAELRDKGKGISYQTSNFYLQAIKQFCRWMVRDGRSSESPVEHLTGMNVKLDRRHDRRSLTAEELVNLLKVTAAGPVRHKLDGQSRAMLYRVAMETGLRRKELRSLTPDCIGVDSETPVIVVQPTDTKNRKPTVQAIRRELAEELRQWIQEAEVAPESSLWPNLTQNTAMMLRKDLKAAEIPYVDDSGRYADFHALRHSYISLITQGGVHPKIAQRLARHSDINLTMSRYSHTLLSDEAEALEVLPEFPSVFDTDRPQQQTLQATGTDDVQLTSSRPDTPKQILPHACTREESVLPLCLPEKGTSEVNSVHLCAVKQPTHSSVHTTTKKPENTRQSLGKRNSNDYDPHPKDHTGEVTEWPNVPVSKTGVPSRVPGVRIPPSPLFMHPQSSSTVCNARTCGNSSSSSSEASVSSSVLIDLHVLAPTGATIGTTTELAFPSVPVASRNAVSCWSRDSTGSDGN
jgi:integrase